MEIRIHTGLEHRVFCMSRFPEAVYVLHAFEKRNRQTPRADVDLARRRLGQLAALRIRREGK